MTPYSDNFFQVIRSNSLERIRPLISKNSINTTDGDGWSVLQLAVVYNKDPRVVPYLLEQGANVDYQTKIQNTALHLAVVESKLECVKVLLSYNANTTIKNRAGLLAEELTKNTEIKTLIYNSRIKKEQLATERLEKTRIEKERHEKERIVQERLQLERKSEERRKCEEQERLTAIENWKRGYTTIRQQISKRQYEYFTQKRPVLKPEQIANGKHEFTVTSVAVSPDSTLALTGSEDCTARLWETITGKELLILRGHEERIKSVAFSPCGNFIVTGSVDRTARVWDIRTAEEVTRLEGHVYAVESVTFSPDGTKILTGSWDCSTKLWDMKTGEERQTFRGHKEYVWNVAFSLCGNFAVTGGDDCVINIWNVYDGSLKSSITTPHKIRAAQFFSDNDIVIAAHADGVIRVWNVHSHSVVREFSGHTADLWSVSVYSDKDVMVSCGKDKTVKIWDISRTEILLSVEQSSPILSAVISPDGRFLTTGNDQGEVNFYILPDTIANRKQLEQERLEKERIERERLERERIVQKRLQLERETEERRKCEEQERLTAIENWKREYTTVRQQISKRQNEYLVQKTTVVQSEEIACGKHEFPVTSVAISPDSMMALTGSEDCTARLWETATGKELLILRGYEERIRSVAFSPCGNFVATGSVDTTARIWDIRTAEEVTQLKGHAYAVESVAFSPDGTQLLTGSWDCTAKLWDIKTGEEKQTFRGHNENVWSAAFSPCGDFAVTGGNDCFINIWDIYQGTLRSSINAPNTIRAAQFYADANIVIAALGDSIVRVWNVHSRSVVREFIGHTADLWSVSVYSDKDVMVSCGKDKTVKIWDILKAAVLCSFEQSAPVLSAVISPDGHFLATGNDQGEVYFYFLPDTIANRKQLEEKRIAQKRIDEIATSINDLKNTAMLEALKAEIDSLPSSHNRDKIYKTICDKLIQIYFDEIRIEFESRIQSGDQEEIDILEKILYRFTHHQINTIESQTFRLEVERYIEEIKLSEETVAFESCTALNHFERIDVLEEILKRLRNNIWKHLKKQAQEMKLKIERCIEEIKINKEEITLEGCGNLRPSEKINILAKILGRLCNNTWKHLKNQAQEMELKIERYIEEIKINEEIVALDSNTDLSHFESINVLEGILKRLHNNTWRHLKKQAQEMELKIERYIEEIKLNKEETTFVGCDNLKHSEKIKALTEILEHLRNNTWSHLKKQAQDIQSRVEEQIKITQHQEKLVALQIIVSDLEETLPKTILFLQKSFFPFDQNCIKWEMKTRNDPAPRDLQDEYDKLVHKRNRLYLWRNTFAIPMLVAVLLILVMALTFFTREQLYRRNLLTTFTSFVEQKDILKIEEQYRLIEREKPDIMKRASFMKSQKVYEQLAEARNVWKQDFADACAKFQASIQEAEADIENINATALDRASLTMAKELASRPLVHSDVDMSIIESFEADFVAVERKANEQKRQKKFRALVQKCDDSIQKAKDNPKEYQPNVLDELSLKMLTPETDTEKDDKMRIERSYYSVKTERVRQDHINKIEDLSAKITHVIKEATDSTPYKPELLDRNLLKQLQAEVIYDHEADMAYDFNHQFQSIHDMFIKQSTFSPALKQAKNSIEKAKELNDESQLDIDALNAALDNATTQDECLAAEKVQQSFESVKQEAFAQRKEDLEKFISQKRKILEDILGNSLNSNEENARKLADLKNELLEEAKRIQTLTKKGYTIDATTRGKASVLYTEVSNALKKFQEVVTAH